MVNYEILTNTQNSGLDKNNLFLIFNLFGIYAYDFTIKESIKRWFIIGN